MASTAYADDETAETAPDSEASAGKTAKPTKGSLVKHVGAQATMRANANWQRAEYVRSRGHRTYVAQAKRCNRFYVGAGEQWEPTDAAALIASNRKPVEDNRIMQMVNTAIGYQIANRMDIDVRPRGRGADDQKAEVMGKVMKYLADDTQLHWRETEVFADGMIMQRGYFDIRMSFERNALGEAIARSLDPCDVMPDPDARAYDSEDWADVTVDRWYSLDQIEQLFGRAARLAVETYETPDQYASSTDLDGLPRARFGQEGAPGYVSEFGEHDCGLYHVIDRQYRSFEMTLCAVWPTGDIRPIPDATKEQRQAYVDQGALLVKRMTKRVKWMVSTQCVSLFDDYSPYPWFTIVPFFPYFRRGVTRGMVDNAISMQEVLNKALSQFGHILNTVANSGWLVEDGSLKDYRNIEEFRADAAKNGLLLVYKKDTTKPEKIEASSPPSGIVEYIAHAQAAIAGATGMDQTLGVGAPIEDLSGVAYQARQYAAQQKLAVPLDNLGRTRYGVANRYIDLVQMFMDTPRIIRITEQDPYGRPVTSELAVNQPMGDTEGGEPTDWVNDLTLGEYDLVISEQPMQVTFDNSQFNQLESLAKNFGYRVPPAIALRYSALADKAEVAEAIDANSQQQVNPMDEAKAALAKAQAALTDAQTVNARIEAVYGATQAGAQIATIPQVASIADEVLQSAGFQDQNAAPIIPQGQVGAGLAAAAPPAPLVTGNPGDPNGPAPENTHPLEPAHAGTGMTAGLEAQGVQ